MRRPATIWVISADRTLRGRWEPSFREEGWQSAFLAALAALVGVVKAGGAAGPALAVIDADLLEPAGSQKQLAALRGSGLHYLLFGRKERHGDEAVIRHLDAGADDFFDPAQEPRVIVARVRAHLRGAMAAADQVLISPGRGVKLDTAARMAWGRSAKGGWKELPKLTSKEYSLLLLFLRRPGTALRRRDILEEVWGGPAADVNPGTVDRHITALRRKLGPSGSAIRTLHGLGYAFKEGASAS